MKPKLLLRIASALILVHLLGHGVGHSTWTRPEDPKMREVVAAMLGYEAEFMGAMKSMGDYFNGYSLMMFFVFGMSIRLLWLASGTAHDQKRITRKMLLPIGIAYAAFGVIEFLHFFPFAAGMSLAAGLLTLYSAFLLRE